MTRRRTVEGDLRAMHAQQAKHERAAGKVYAITTHLWMGDRWSSRQLDIAIRATSLAAAARAVGISPATMKKYASVGAGGEWAAAATVVGQVMIRTAGSMDAFRPWTRPA